MQHIFTKSAHLHGFDYDSSTRVATVTFQNGSVYKHYNVPEAAMENWIKYYSPGKFYTQVIRRYAGEKL